MDTTVSYTEARNHLKEIMDTVAKDHITVRIQRRGGENAVVMSESDYRSLQETLHLLSNPANAERLLEARQRGIEQAVPWEDAKRLLDL